MESDYGHVLYYTKIRWLSRGKCWNLKDEIKYFIKANCSDVPELEDEHWFLDLCFLVDITKKLNELIQKLQGKDKLITDSFEDIHAFMTKLKLYERQLTSENAVHFAHLNSFNCDNKDFTKYSGEITKLVKAFQERYAYLRKFDQLFKIFVCPFDAVIEAPDNLQLELIDLRTSTELKSLFCTIDKLQFYREYVPKEEFPNLRHLAMRITAAIGTTYACKSFFQD